MEHPPDLPCTPGQKTICLVKMSDHRMRLQPTERETCALVLFGNNLDKIKKTLSIQGHLRLAKTRSLQNWQE